MSVTSGAPQIRMHVLHDGRVGLVLAADWYHGHELRVVRVDDREAIIDTIRTWAGLARSRGEGVPIGRLYAEFPESREAYPVVLTATPGDELRRFSPDAARLSRAYADAFAGDARDPAVVESFAEVFARALQEFFTRSRHRAEARLAGGAYRQILEGYVTRLRGIRTEAEQSAYLRVSEDLGAIMEDERYLMLSADPAARDAYARVQDEIAALYNWYMDLAKGGNVRAR